MKGPKFGTLKLASTNALKYTIKSDVILSISRIRKFDPCLTINYLIQGSEIRNPPQRSLREHPVFAALGGEKGQPEIRLLTQAIHNVPKYAIKYETF